MDEELKGHLGAMEERINARLESVEERFSARLETIEERFSARLETAEDRINVRVEASETRLLREFWKWARTADARYRQHQGVVNGLAERVGIVEDRVADLEREKP